MSDEADLPRWVIRLWVVVRAAILSIIWYNVIRKAFTSLLQSRD